MSIKFHWLSLWSKPQLIKIVQYAADGKSVLYWLDIGPVGIDITIKL